MIYSGTGTHATDRRLRNGVRYRYVVTVVDQAGNATATRLSAVPTASSLRPVNGSLVVGPPRLRWGPAKGARYYNVQLMRKGRKILSMWPRGTHLQLPAVWTFRGKSHRLTPGAYRWYVWPGVRSQVRTPARRYSGAASSASPPESRSGTD
jgi:hypothetical protein